MPRCDVAIVGAGIVGLAHAVIAARLGLRVCVFERDEWARGASVRNFGMYWPIGQPTGPLYDRAVRSGRVWRELSQLAGFWFEPVGSLHAAYREDELRVLEEFVAAAGDASRPVELVGAVEAVRRNRGIRQEGLLGAMWSPTEACVDPREAIAAIARYLQDESLAEIHFQTSVSRVESGRLETSAGETWDAAQIFICSGSEFRTLLPEAFDSARLIRCKLQMMRTGPQPNGWRLGPHLATGLTLRHYGSWSHCPSLPALRDRIAREHPELDRWGIHVLVSQNQQGELIIGDSHEYGSSFEPGGRSEVDALILDYLRSCFDAPDLSIKSRWQGIYAKCRDGKAEYVTTPIPGVTVVTGLGGAGMTLSFGLAEELLGAVPACTSPGGPAIRPCD